MAGDSSAPASQPRLTSKTAKPDDSEVTGPFVRTIADRMRVEISYARRRLDAVLEEVAALGGLDGDYCATRRERRRTARIAVVEAVRLQALLRKLELNVERLSLALRDSPSPVAIGPRDRTHVFRALYE